MSKNNKPKKTLDPNVVGASLETTSDEVLTTETVEETAEVKEEAPVEEAPKEEVKEEVIETPVEEPVADEKKEEEPVPVPVEPGPVIIEEDPKEETPEEPVPVPVEPGPVIVEEPKEEAPASVEEKKEETVEAPKATESSQFAGKYALCIYASPRRSVDDISDELNTNRRFVADNIIIDREHDRVVLQTSDNNEELRKTQKKYLSAGIKTVIAKA